MVAATEPPAAAGAIHRGWLLIGQSGGKSRRRAHTAATTCGDHGQHGEILHVPFLYCRNAGRPYRLQYSDEALKAVNPDMARRLWIVFEPYSAMVYFAPEARAAYTDAGLKGYWMGYFGSRAAAFGAVSADVVEATFYNFAPHMVRRAIPDAWRFSTPHRIMQARLVAADAALRRLLGDTIDAPTIIEATELTREALAACTVAGRPLFAAHRSLAWPDVPHLALWHAATLLREYRGDGHVAALLAAGIDGCEAHVLQVAAGTVPRPVLQSTRGWSDEDWAAAAERLRRRGYADAAGAITAEGRDSITAVERQTDTLALPPWVHLGQEAVERLDGLVRPLSRRIAEAGGIPFPNPVGVPSP